MPLIKYEPGQQFPGVIGRTADESSAGVAHAERAARARRTSCSSCSTTPGFGQLGCFGSPIDTPNLDTLRGQRIALQQTCPRRRCARPAVRASSPVVITTAAMSVVRSSGSGSCGLDGTFPFGSSCRRYCSHAATTRTCSESRISSRAARNPVPGPTTGGAARPRLRALLQFSRRRPEFKMEPRARVQQPTQIEPPPRPQSRATAWARPTWPRKAMQFIADARAGRPRRAVSPSISSRRERTRRAAVPKEWADKSAGRNLNDGWSTYRAKTWPGGRNSDRPPKLQNFTRTDPDIPESGIHSRIISVACPRVRWRCSRASSAIPTTTLVTSSSSCARSTNSTTRPSWWSPKRASAEGGVTGTTNEDELPQQLPGILRGEPQGHRRARRTRALQSLP